MLSSIDFLLFFRYDKGGGKMAKTTIYSNTFHKFLLLLADILLLYLALWLALSIRYQNEIDWQLFINHAQPFTAVYILWLGIFYTNNLYNLTRIRHSVDLYFDTARALLIGVLIAIIVFYLLPENDLTPKRLLLINAVLFGVLATLWRSAFVQLMRNHLPINKVAIVGITNNALELARQLKTSLHRGYCLVALTGNGSQVVNIPQQMTGTIQIFTKPNELMPLIENCSIDTIIFAGNQSDQFLVNQLFNRLSAPIKFYALSDFYEEFNNKIPVTELNQAWFLNNINETDKRSLDVLKRFLDIVMSLTLLIILSPVVIISGIAVIIESPGSMFYVQKRTGKQNQLFTLYKLRTMISNAEATGPQWSQKSDSRVTKVGRFLRRTRIDEIPQLLNILKGDMGFIGSRPERPEFIETLTVEIPFYSTRHLIKPGLTGWAQVNFPYGASVKDALEKLQYDLYYIKHRSLSLDLSIIIRTIIVVLGSKGR